MKKTIISLLVALMATTGAWAQIVVTDNGDGSYSFTMPAYDVEVSTVLYPEAAVTTAFTATTGVIVPGRTTALFTGGASTQGTIYYAIGADGTNAPTGDVWGTDVLTAASCSAGQTVYVWYKITGKDNGSEDTYSNKAATYAGFTVAMATSEQVTAINNVETLISAIGSTITSASSTAISNARTAYDALASDLKAVIKNIDDLTAAETALGKLTTLINGDGNSGLSGIVSADPSTGNVTATLNGGSNTTLAIGTNATVDAVVLDRTFTDSSAATLMLPFEISVSNTVGATFYTYTGVTFDGVSNKWKATMTEVSSGNITAGTPYLVMPSGTDITFTGGATLNTTTGTKQTTQGDWTFKGTYEEKTWDGSTNNDYGFAATAGKAIDGVTDVAAGDFVRFANGAHLKPMRCYLTYTGGGNPWAGARSSEPTGLPESISVVLVNADGTTTEIGTITRSEGEGAWYSFDGLKLDSKPSKKGMYINNGKKVVVK